MSACWPGVDCVTAQAPGGHQAGVHGVPPGPRPRPQPPGEVSRPPAPRVPRPRGCGGQRAATPPLHPLPHTWQPHSGTGDITIIIVIMLLLSTPPGHAHLHPLPRAAADPGGGPHLRGRRLPQVPLPAARVRHAAQRPPLARLPLELALGPEHPGHVPRLLPAGTLAPPLPPLLAALPRPQQLPLLLQQLAGGAARPGGRQGADRAQAALRRALPALVAGRGQRGVLLQPRPLLAPPLPPHLVTLLAHPRLAGEITPIVYPSSHLHCPPAVFRGGRECEVPAAGHGHALAEGGGARLEGQDRAKGGLQEPLQIRAQRAHRHQGEH